jgi:hypothetical protein
MDQGMRPQISMCFGRSECPNLPDFSRNREFPQGLLRAHLGFLDPDIKRPLLLNPSRLEIDSQPVSKPRQKGIAHPVMLYESW